MEFETGLLTSDVGLHISILKICIFYSLLFLGVLLVRFLIRKAFRGLPSHLSTIIASLLPVYLGVLLKPIWMLNDSLFYTALIPFIIFTLPILAILFFSSWIKILLTKQPTLQAQSSKNNNKILVIIIILVALPVVSNLFFNSDLVSSEFFNFGTKKNYIDGCLEITVSDTATRSNISNLLSVNNIDVPELGDPTSYAGAFLIPSFNVFTYDFDATRTRLLQDQRISNVEKRSGPNVHDGKYEVHVVFIESVTREQGYDILTNEYGITVNGNKEYAGTKKDTLTISIAPGSEKDVSQILNESPLIKKVDRCEETFIKLS